nr:hypothetical protein [Bacteroidota bacterium]
MKYHHSGDIDAKSPDPVPLFSKFYIYNDEVQPDTVLAHKKHLVIDPDDDFLTFEVAAINYLFPEDNYFQYMIPQFSTEWINLGSNRTIPLINLKPGKYILKLRVSSDNQSWQVNEASLTLFVLPYFYETLWFKIGAFLMTAMVLIGMFLIRVNLLKRQEIKLQTLVDQQTSKLKDTNFQLKEEVVIRRITENLLREANATKDKFFSIIAHDLRNPFNALLGLTEILYDQWDELSDPDKLEMIDTIRKDSENTYKLLVNLLDWSKIQKGAMKPKIEKTNLKETISNTLMELAANVDMKSIRVFNELLNHSYVAADQFMLKTIFRNILSNAIKFTPKEGQIVITSQQKERSVICVVSDTGVGMSESKRKKLFSVENTQSDPGTDGEIGTGLGLVITYEFVRLLDGKIWVESLHGKGTKFFVLIPKSF